LAFSPSDAVSTHSLFGKVFAIIFVKLTFPTTSTQSFFSTDLKVVQKIETEGDRSRSSDQNNGISNKLLRIVHAADGETPQTANTTLTFARAQLLFSAKFNSDQIMLNSLPHN